MVEQARGVRRRRSALPPCDRRSRPDRPLPDRLGRRAAGFIQTYRTGDHPEYRDLVEVEEDVSGVDLFVADERLTGRGLGSDVLRQFVHDVVFANPATPACIADPDTENLASIRAFQKAGFAAVRQFVDPTDGDRLHTLMRIDRSY